MSTVEEIQDQIVEEFEMLGGDLEMSNVYLMELGQKLPDLPEEDHTEENIVKGCQSKVWMTSWFEGGNVFYKGDSNTAITKGLLSLLIRIFSGQTPEDIRNTELTFIDRIGLNRFIGTQRSNGLSAMIKQMKLDAVAHEVANHQ